MQSALWTPTIFGARQTMYSPHCILTPLTLSLPDMNAFCPLSCPSAICMKTSSVVLMVTSALPLALPS